MSNDHSQYFQMFVGKTIERVEANSELHDEHYGISEFITFYFTDGTSVSLAPSFPDREDLWLQIAPIEDLNDLKGTNFQSSTIRPKSIPW